MIENVRDISIEDYNYPLPEERIAKYPLNERDASKLLVLKNNEFHSSNFRNIGDFLPEDSLLVFNETKVVRARLQFTKESGAAIEIFCFGPITGTGDYQLACGGRSPSRWKCLVGNSRRWKNDILSLDLGGGGAKLFAERIEKNDNYSVIEFSWDPSDLSFAEIGRAHV